MKKIIARYPIASFIFLTGLFTFILAPLISTLLTLVLQQVNQTLNQSLYQAFFVYSPAIAALSITYLLGRLGGVKALLSQIKPRQNAVLLYALMPILTLSIVILSFFLTGYDTNLVLQHLLTSKLDYLMLIGGQILLVALGEELGWRGFLLPNLLKRFSPALSSVFVFIIWACWHIPKFIAMPNSLLISALLVNLLAFSFCFTYLYIKQQQHLLLIILFHACANSALMLFEPLVNNSIISLDAFLYIWLCSAFIYCIPATVFLFHMVKSNKGLTYN
ncbi:CPBP family intramembrane glutamic endopeptidase [Paraglaciecola aestuariivivens]